MIRYLHLDKLVPKLAGWLAHRVCFFLGPRIGYVPEKFIDKPGYGARCKYCDAPELIYMG